MANTYTQIHIQLVFAVKGRENLIREDFRERLQSYICGIVNERENKPLAIYCMPDHTHLLIGLRPAIALADLMR
ncbi:MAG: transposase, partial [Thermoflexibacter sp.]|nr:transposase [Thermoflexibacter sp.]